MSAEDLNARQNERAPIVDGGNVRFDPLPARCKRISDKEKLPFFSLSSDVWTEKGIFQMILSIKNCRNTGKEREKEWMSRGECGRGDGVCKRDSGYS